MTMETCLARNGISSLHVEPADITPSPRKLTPSSAGIPIDPQTRGRQTESTLSPRKDQAMRPTEAPDPDVHVCHLTEAEIRRREIARFYGE
jgi:hypothetical protein